MLGKESAKCVMDYPKKSNKIRDIVRLQQILKKWKRLANGQKSSSNSNTCCSSNSNKGIKFLKTSLSFTEAVPKGYLAVCVGKELKRFVIPTHYLTHQAFRMLLREAEEEFGFQQEGVLQIPCDVSVFENILNTVQHNHQPLFFQNHPAPDNEIIGLCCSPDCELRPQPHHHPQMCT